MTSSTVPPATAPYDYAALWTKAKLFINRAMDEYPPRDFDEQALWASLGLELLAKAALAKHSPLLIAVPTEDGINLLIASGLAKGDARFKSIPAHTLFDRCSKAFRPFNPREAMHVANARNDYLHGTGVAFAVLPPEVWWARYWSQARILVEAFDTDLEDLVGDARVGTINRYLENNQKNIEDRVESLIARATQRFELHKSGSLSAKLAAEWAKPVSLDVGLSHHADQTCPACRQEGRLEGDTVEDVEIKSEQSGPEDWDSWAEVTVGSDYFSCNHCRLVLDGYELVAQAELPVSFVVIGDTGDYYEPDYGND